MTVTHSELARDPAPAGGGGPAAARVPLPAGPRRLRQPGPHAQVTSHREGWPRAPRRVRLGGRRVTVTVRVMVPAGPAEARPGSVTSNGTRDSVTSESAGHPRARRGGPCAFRYRLWIQAWSNQNAGDSKGCSFKFWKKPLGLASCNRDIPARCAAPGRRGYGRGQYTSAPPVGDFAGFRWAIQKVRVAGYTPRP